MKTQAEFLARVLPHIERGGLLYRKWKAVKARPATAGEYIETITSDGLETVNTAEEGDFLVQNDTASEERYLVSGHKFRDRYEKVEDIEDGWALYKPSGEVLAIQLKADRLLEMHLPTSFAFMAPWGELMRCQLNDFLVCPPDKSEVYCIGRQEFLETYALAE